MKYSLGDPAGVGQPGVRHVVAAGGAGAGNTYTVYKDGIPYLEAALPLCGWNRSFQAACLFREYLCVGMEDRVYFVSIETGGIREMQVALYFGQFREQGERLYIASGESLYCLDRDCNPVWTAGSIAVDGIRILEMEDGAIRVLCEMDPPGGWVERWISLEDGSLLSEHA